MKPNRKPSPVEWSNPPPGAIAWLQAVIESARESSERILLQDVRRQSEIGYSAAEIAEHQKVFGEHSRASTLAATLLLRSEGNEYERLMLWLREGFTPPELPPSEWLSADVADRRQHV